jgi:hypothetical protein
MAAASPSASQVLGLYRALVRESRKFANYNVREYAKRRTIAGFQDNRALSDPAALAMAFVDGQQNLELVKRQAIVYNLYAPVVKSIMDLKASPVRK